MRTCPHCNTPNRDDASFCANCGENLPLVDGTLLELGRYRIERELARGGYGVIYVAQDVRLKRPCVVKHLLQPNGAGQDEIADLSRTFEREAEALVGLNRPGHPSIPEIYDFFSDPLGNYLVMKYIEGESLGARAVRLGGHLPWQEAVEITAQVADALAYMHSRKPDPVLHRDIKPFNILVDLESRVWLVDFGLSKAQPATDGWAGGTTMAGSVGYTPLEQWMGRAGPASDVYALGATLHYLVTGIDPTLPFEEAADEPHLARLIRQYHGRFVPIRQIEPSLPVALEAAVGAAVQPRPERRPGAAEWKAELDGLLAPGIEPIHLRGGAVAYNPAELVAACTQNWEDARFHLYRGDFEDRLRRWGRTDLESQAAGLCRQYAHDQDAGLDAFIRLLDPQLPPPCLQLTHRQLDFGSVPRGQPRSLVIGVANAGQGYMPVSIQPSSEWVKVQPQQFGCLAGQTVRVEVQVTAGGPPATPGSGSPAGKSYGALLACRAGSGGTQSVSVTLFIPSPVLRVSPRHLDFELVYGGQPVLADWIEIANLGQSYLDATVTPSVPWLTASPAQVRVEPGRTATARLYSDTTGLALRRQHQAALDISTPDAGQIRVTVAATASLRREVGRRVLRTWPGRVGLALLALLAIMTGLRAYQAIRYTTGLWFARTGQWAAARGQFSKADLPGLPYRDAREQARECLYYPGGMYMSAGEWEKALAELEALAAVDPGYKDVQARLAECRYQVAIAAMQAGRWEAAAAGLKLIETSYKDVPARLAECHYRLALAAVAAGDRASAVSLLMQVMAYDDGYRDAMGRLGELLKGMVFVPAGEFLMGSADGDSQARSHEKPQHRVALDAFWIGKTEVTSAEYAECARAGRCQAAGCMDDGRFNGDEQPVVCVSWRDAQSYCAWIGGRLPTEAEWEKAARGTDGRLYPWGNDPPDCDKAQYWECKGDTLPVGSKPAGASPYGALDMAGNAWEWVGDWYDSAYYARSPAANPTGPDADKYRVMRGGSYDDPWDSIRAASRFPSDPALRYEYFGFRCVVASP